jgi:predicted dithiol-disulfide oxidoreductase (DUF899 family)
MTDSGHRIGTREEWLAARLALLAAEKEHTRRGDALALMRQQLPWVPVDKEYEFETDAGQASLPDLFQGCSQLIVYHLMFGPEYSAACPSCSAIADGFNGFHVHLANHDVMLCAVSRGPLAKLQSYKKRMGWSFPWASSAGSDFNSDFAVGFSPEEQRRGIYYNYRQESPWRQRENAERDAYGTGVDLDTYLLERPGISAFALENGVVYHTYSAYARGVDAVWGMWHWLDRAPRGRNPKSSTETGHWWRRHDEYGKLEQTPIVGLKRKVGGT